MASPKIPAGTPIGTGIGGGTLVTDPSSPGGVREVPMSSQPMGYGGGGRSFSEPTSIDTKSYESQLLKQSFPTIAAKESAEAQYRKQQQVIMSRDKIKQETIQSKSLGGQLMTIQPTAIQPTAKEELLGMSLPLPATWAGRFIRSIETPQAFKQKIFEEEVVGQIKGFESLGEDELFEKSGLKGSRIIGMSTPEGSSYTFFPDVKKASSISELKYEELPFVERVKLRSQEVGLGLTKGIVRAEAFSADIVFGMGGGIIEKGETRSGKILGRTEGNLARYELFQELFDKPTGGAGLIGEVLPITYLAGRSIFRGIKSTSGLGLTKSERFGEIVRGFSPIQTQTTFQPIVTAKNIPVGKITRFPTEYGSIDMFQGTLKGIPGSRIFSGQVSGGTSYQGKDLILGGGVTSVSLPQFRLVGTKLLSGRVSSVSYQTVLSPRELKTLGFAKKGLGITPEGFFGQRQLTISQQVFSTSEFGRETTILFPKQKLVPGGRGILRPLFTESKFKISKGVVGEKKLAETDFGDIFVAVGAKSYRDFLPYGKPSFFAIGQELKIPKADSITKVGGRVGGKTSKSSKSFLSQLYQSIPGTISTQTIPKLASVKKFSIGQAYATTIKGRQSSVYAGTGLYERTDLVQGKNLQNFQIQTTSLSTLTKERQRVKYSYGSGYADLIYAQKTKTIPRTATIQIQPLKDGLKTRTVLGISSSIPKGFDTPRLRSFPTRVPTSFPISSLSLGSKFGRGSSLLGRFSPRYSPSLTASTFNLKGIIPTRFKSGRVDPFGIRVIPRRKKKK